jgi:hypothetical protein
MGSNSNAHDHYLLIANPAVAFLVNVLLLYFLLFTRGSILRNILIWGSFLS